MGLQMHGLLLRGRPQVRLLSGTFFKKQRSLPCRRRTLAFFFACFYRSIPTPRITNSAAVNTCISSFCATRPINAAGLMHKAQHNRSYLSDYYKHVVILVQSAGFVLQKQGTLPSYLCFAEFFRKTIDFIWQSRHNTLINTELSCAGSAPADGEQGGIP